jgi:putative endopeptidase
MSAQAYLDIPLPIDPNNLDKSVSPQQNFYRFANGGWLDRNPIPSDYSRWGCFEELAERNYVVLKKLLEESELRKGDLVGELFNSGMNIKAIEQAGLSVIQDLLTAIEKLKTSQDVLGLVAQFHSEGLDIAGSAPLFSISAQPDARNSSWVLAHLGQDGLGLPDRDYYFDDDKAEIRAKYKDHVRKVFELAAIANAEQKVSDVFDIESFLAEASLKMVERRDPVKTYNKHTYEELKSLCGISWDHYFKTLQMKDNFGDLILDNPKFFKALQQALERFSISQWQSYLQWFLLGASSSFLPEPFDTEHFSFYGKVLTGQEEQKPRWKRVMGTVSALIRDLFGKLYVEIMFPPEAKKAALEMVELLRSALRERLNNLEWMEDATKVKALEKLNKFAVKIGYPDKWEEYAGVSLDRNLPYFENVRRASRGEVRKGLNRVNREVERWRWEMPPFLVNAYYHPVLNEIVFPAAILQPPFFYPPTSEKPLGEGPVNFGGIGAVIGHEVSTAPELVMKQNSKECVFQLDDAWYSSNLTLSRPF